MSTKLRKEYYARRPDIAGHARNGSASAPAVTAARRFAARSTRRTSWRSLRRSATTAAARASPARSSSGKDTHALSEPAFATALEVLAANDVDVMIDRDDGYTPTPAVSHAILTYNRGRTSGLADGIVITPSHNPPEDGGFKYNPPHGGPADTDVTRWIEDRANRLLSGDLTGVARIAYEEARRRADDPRARLRRVVRERSGFGGRHGRHPERRSQDRRRSAWRRERRVLAADRRTLRDRRGGREHHGRSDLRLHVAGLGRQDPHGLLVSATPWPG